MTDDHGTTSRKNTVTALVTETYADPDDRRIDQVATTLLQSARGSDDPDYKLEVVQALRDLTGDVWVQCEECGSPVGPLTNFVCEATDECWDIAYCPLCGKVQLEYEGWCEHLVGWNGGCMFVINGVTADWPALRPDLPLSHDYSEDQLRDAFGGLTFAAQLAYDLDAPNLAEAYRQVEVRFGYEDESALTAELLKLAERECGLWAYGHGDGGDYGICYYADTPEKATQAGEVIRRAMWGIGEALLALAGMAPEV